MAPSHLRPVFRAANIWNREDAVHHWVNSYIRCYFTKQGEKGKTFDLLYSIPDKDYHTSWQKLSQISSRLAGLANPQSHMEFIQICGQIVDRVHVAFRQTNEANALIFFWRVCRHFLDIRPAENAQCRLPIDLLLSTIVDATRNDLNGSSYLFNRLAAVVYEAPREQKARLLERGYYEAIQEMKRSWDRQTFTIPQMETNYLLNWNAIPCRGPALIIEHDRLISRAREIFPGDHDFLYIFRYQFLFFLSQSKQDTGVICRVAKSLYIDARRSLEMTPGFPWDGKSNSFKFAARILTTVHGQTLLQNVPEEVRQNAIDKGFAYPIDAYNVLSRGNGECRYQADLLLRDLGGGEIAITQF